MELFIFQVWRNGDEVAAIFMEDPWKNKNKGGSLKRDYLDKIWELGVQISRGDFSLIAEKRDFVDLFEESGWFGDCIWKSGDSLHGLNEETSEIVDCLK